MGQSTYINDSRVIGDHGQLLDHRTEVTVSKKTNNEPEFVKLYVEQWLTTMRGKPSIMTEVLVALINIGLTFAGNRTSGGMIVHASRFEKQAVADKLGCSLSNVSNTITKLVAVGALKRVERGVYQVNPNLMGKGNWSDIKALQISWQFEDSGTSNETVVVN